MLFHIVILIKIQCTIQTAQDISTSDVFIVKPKVGNHDPGIRIYNNPRFCLINIKKSKFPLEPTHL